MVSSEEKTTDTNPVTKKPEGFPPAFWTELSETDETVLHANLSTAKKDFDTSFVYAVATRCKHGYPQVLVCKPFMGDGTPFPTTFWLVCPYLDKKCGELESEQKVAEFEKTLATLKEDLTEWHKAYGALRKKLADCYTDNVRIKNIGAIMASFEKYGVGGINYSKNPCFAKCLHLQTATWLGWEHPAAEKLKEMIGCIHCKNGSCSQLLNR